MFQVLTQNSTYEFNTNNRTFRRIPDKGTTLVKDLEWTPYIYLHQAEIGKPMVIEWSLNGTRKYRTTTSVVDIDLLEE